MVNELYMAQYHRKSIRGSTILHIVQALASYFDENKGSCLHGIRHSRSFAGGEYNGCNKPGIVIDL